MFFQLKDNGSLQLNAEKSVTRQSYTSFYEGEYLEKIEQ